MISLQLGSQFSVWNFQVFTQVAAVAHQDQEAVIDISQLVIFALNVRYVHVVGGWTNIFVLLAVEDIDADHVNLGVTVLA